MKIDYSLIGKRLAEARKSIKITQKEAADLIGVTKSYITGMENGKKPSLEYLLTISAKTNVSLDWILMGVQNSTDNKLTLDKNDENMPALQDDFLTEIAAITDGIGPEGKAVLLGVIRTIAENSGIAREKTIPALDDIDGKDPKRTIHA